MNPLRKKQIEKLEDLGLTDVARKIQELIDAHNELLSHKHKLESVGTGLQRCDCGASMADIIQEFIDTHTVKEDHKIYVYRGDEVWKCKCGGNWRHDSFGGKKNMQEEPTTSEKKPEFHDSHCNINPCFCSARHRKELPTSSYEVTCGRCEKSIKHLCGRV